MAYKILESNTVYNENVDGAAFNNFCAGGQDGVLSGILNECAVYLIDSNTLGIDTGELLIQGFRVKVTTPQKFVATSSASNITYHIIAALTLESDRDVTFSLDVVESIPALPSDNLFTAEQGSYAVILAAFTTGVSGITHYQRILPVITAGLEGEDGFSPTIQVTSTTGGHKVSITDKSGVQEFSVLNGRDGEKGEKGEDYVLTDQDKKDISDLVPKEVQNITSIDTIYNDKSLLPTSGVSNGTRYVALSNGKIPLFIYSWDANTNKWDEVDQVRPSTAYIVLTGENAGMYRYTMAAPYFVSVESHTLQEAKDYTDTVIEEALESIIDRVLEAIPNGDEVYY